jgi:hypothetical protein
MTKRITFLVNRRIRNQILHRWNIPYKEGKKIGEVLFKLKSKNKTKPQ